MRKCDGAPATPTTLLALAFLLAAPSAFAHEQTGAAAGFLTGLRHPVSGLDHVLAATPTEASCRRARADSPTRSAS
jgi:hydrogenase/urease accessory protein HupE